MDASWWPKHTAWVGSGLDVGYWAPFCEEWFQTRRKILQDQGAQKSGAGALRTAGAWRTSLTQQNGTAPFVSRSWEFAENYLHRMRE